MFTIHHEPHHDDNVLYIGMVVSPFDLALRVSHFSLLGADPV